MNGLGAKLLTKMGWKEGTGLGAKRNGMVEPLSTRKRKDNAGIGAQRQRFEDAWWERAMEEAYGKGSAKMGEGDLLEACEGRRCRPHGSAKLARLEAQDRKRREEEGAEKEEGESEANRKKEEGRVKRRREGVRKVQRKKRSKQDRKAAKSISKAVEINA